MYISARTGFAAIPATGAMGPCASASGMVAVTVTFVGLAVLVTDTAVSMIVTVLSSALPMTPIGPAWARGAVSNRRSRGTTIGRAKLARRTTTREGVT